MYFALYKDGNSGYFKLTPTNANYRGSKELWNTTEINYLYYDGSSVGISSSYNNSNKSSWYVVMHNDGKYFILNRYYPNIALNWFLGNPSVSTGEVSFSSVSHKWEFIPVGLDVPLIEQEPNLCGPCSTLQVITFKGKDGLISGSDISAKQNTLNANPYKCYSCYNICQTLSLSQFDFENNYMCYTSKDHPDYNSATSPYTKLDNITEVTKYISDSLKSGQPVILLTFNTGAFSYYHDQMFDHFLCIVGYDEGRFITRDCNDTSRTVNGVTYEFFGEHIISESELNDAIFYKNTLDEWEYGWINCAEHTDLIY